MFQEKVENGEEHSKYEKLALLFVFGSSWTLTVLLKTVNFPLFFQYEQEEIRQRENQQKIPEFVRVKDNLRRTQTPEQ